MLPITLRYLKSEDDALEVLNDAFLKVFSKIGQYKAEGSLESWIKRIVINASIDFVRKSKSYRANFIPTREFHLYGEPQDESEDLEAFPDISQEAIFELVAGLPQATRVVFNLYVIDLYSHKQISKHLQISEGTSKWHLSNARKILRQKIETMISAKNKNPLHG